MTERTNADYAKGLRAIADWYEANPDAPQPHTCLQVFTVHTKEQAVAVARMLGRCDKQWAGEQLHIGRDFGGERVEFIFDRATVCTRRVVGVEEVPQRIEPAYTREKVEWDCHPLLAPTAAP